MQRTFKVVFTGTLNPGIPSEKVREYLLKIFKHKHEIVDRFFSRSHLLSKKLGLCIRDKI